MSWSSVPRAIAVLAGTLALLMLASCSGFRPVYGDGVGPSDRYAFDYASPASRLDQVIYTELRLRLGPEAPGSDALAVAVAASPSVRPLTRTGVVKPATTNQATVTATVSVSRPDGTVVFSGSRSASALYTTAGQVLADTAAQAEAEERAARALAETIRLAILGALESVPAQ